MSHAVTLMNDQEIKSCRPTDDDHGFGALASSRGLLPLKAMAVHAKITALVAETEVEQVFVNVHPEPIEATYIFPLPDRAAVSRFVMTVGDRRIEGVLKERGEARREYDQAIQAGHRAAITEEERPGVFTMRVGNLMPGEIATVRLSLTGPLPFADGEASYRFPLVVAPRYIPGAPLAGESVGEGTAWDTDAVPDASRITPPVLLPGFPSPVRLRLSAVIDPAGLPLGAVRSSLHALETGRDQGLLKLQIQPGERLDRDFILRFGLAEAAVSSSLTLCPDPDGSGGTFLLTLVPPAAAGASRPRDVVVVLDRSGSMQGWKMVAARRAAARLIDSLTPRDRFQVLAFDNTIEELAGGALLEATDRQRFRAVEMLAKIEARGGTEMAQPLERSADLLAGGYADRDRSLVLITDGQVGNEDQILRGLAPKLRNVRIYTLGVDRAVNAAFLGRLTDLGGGASELVESEERLDEVMDRFHRRIGAPVLTELSLDAEGLTIEAETLVPSRLPDLHAGSPVLISGRYRGGAGAIVVRGAGGENERSTRRIAGRVEAAGPAARIWARGRVRDLEDRFAIGRGDRDALARQITELSLRFGVLSRFTAFIAVDRSERPNPGGQVHRAVQAVELPDGWAQGHGAIGGVVRPASAPMSPAPAGPAPVRARAPESAAAKASMDYSFYSDAEAESAPMKKQKARGEAPRRPAPAPPPPVASDHKREVATDPLRALIEANAKLFAAARDDAERITLLDALLGGLEALAARGAGGASLTSAIDELRRGLERREDPSALWARLCAALVPVIGPLAVPGRDREFWK
jgi:Ca-activated chloride channel family protein